MRPAQVPLPVAVPALPGLVMLRELVFVVLMITRGRMALGVIKLLMIVIGMVGVLVMAVKTYFDRSQGKHKFSF